MLCIIGHVNRFVEAHMFDEKELFQTVADKISGTLCCYTNRPNSYCSGCGGRVSDAIRREPVVKAFCKSANQYFSPPGIAVPSHLLIP